MKKKLFLTLLALVCALCCVFGLIACNNDKSDNTGNGGDNGNNNSSTVELEYGLVGDDHYECKGFADVTDATDVVIASEYNGKPVTEIRNSAFTNKQQIKSVTIPNSITKIGGFAFRGCSGLTEIVLSDSITTIEANAFDGCSSLTSINIPKGVTTIESGTFNRCSSLKSIVIPNNVKFISGEIFADTPIESITLPFVGIDISNQGISVSQMFGGHPDALKTITITGGDSVFGLGACSALTTVNLPETITTIEATAFNGCSSLTNIVIPNSVTTIGDWAFSDCRSLKNIVIPDSVTSIGKRAFEGCTSLESLTVPFIGKARELNADKRFSALLYLFDDVLDFDVDTVPATLKTIVITDTESIAENAFENCSHIASITLPSKLTNIGAHAFSGCHRLVEIYNLSSLEIVKGQSGDNGNIAERALNVYSSLDEKSKLTTTDDGYTFYNDGDDVRLIDYAGDQTNITLPENFNGKNYSIHNLAFEKSKLTGIVISDGVTAVGHMAFWNSTSLSNVTFGNDVKSLGSSAFQSCTALTSVKIPDNVQTIYSMAFIDCTSLKTVIIGDGVETIEAYAFSGCTVLENVVIGSGVQTIWGEAFEQCTNVYYNSTADDWAKIELNNNSELTNAHIYYLGEWEYVDGVPTVKAQ